MEHLSCIYQISGKSCALSRIYEDSIRIEKLYVITKEVLSNITGLWPTEEILVIKIIKNELVTRLTGVISNKRTLWINNIIDLGVRYTKMGI